MKIEPLGARVLVSVLEQEHTTPSGLVLPETAQEKPMEGIVEGVGTEEEMLTDLAVGDRVIFAKYSGTEVKLEGKEYLLMNEDDILARIAN
ncbi:MAG: co-chaperone GroES [Anaerolineales bacterium]|nr:co-chaperone GroES [Anaerolineales bacterium]